MAWRQSTVLFDGIRYTRPSTITQASSKKKAQHQDMRSCRDAIKKGIVPPLRR